MKETARIAVVGAGWWACEFHIPHVLQNPNAELVSLNLMPGVVTCSQVLEALLSAVPIEAANTMGIPEDDPYAEFGPPPVWTEYEKLISQAGLEMDFDPIPKWDFYEAVRGSDLVLTLQTADQALWANLLLTVGVRTPDQATQ